jgi:hypothetical protein
MSRMIYEPPTQATRDRAIRNARAQGLFVRVSNPYTLQLDLDSSEALQHAKDTINKFRDYLTVCEEKVRNSKTAGHFHVILTMRASRPLKDRIFWQTILGSDPMREARNFEWAGAIGRAPNGTQAALYEPLLFVVDEEVSWTEPNDRRAAILAQRKGEPLDASEPDFARSEMIYELVMREEKEDDEPNEDPMHGVTYDDGY